LRQTRCTKLMLMPICLAVATKTQCVISPGAEIYVAATTRASTSASARPVQRTHHVQAVVHR
jgi:hypothetical protein